MREIKILSTYYDESVLGENKAFFKGDELISVVSPDDAFFDVEFMHTLFQAFGIGVQELSKLNAKQAVQLKYLMEDQE